MYDSAFDPYSQLSREMAFSQTLLGKECQACRRALPYGVFDRDSSSRDGRALVCPKCKKTPRLSTQENLSRIREANFSSDAIASQRRPGEEDYMDRDFAGRVLHSSLIVNKLKDAGIKIVCGPAAFMEEVSLYVEDNRHPNGALYVGWLPVGPVHEFSEYEYNDYLVPTDEITHGYRGVLKNLILNGYLTEDKCNKFFGHCDETVWKKAMWDYRNPRNPWRE